MDLSKSTHDGTRKMLWSSYIFPLYRNILKFKKSILLKNIKNNNISFGRNKKKILKKKIKKKKIKKKTVLPYKAND